MLVADDAINHKKSATNAEADKYTENRQLNNKKQY